MSTPTEIPAILLDADVNAALRKFQELAEREDNLRIVTAKRLKRRCASRHWTGYLQECWARSNGFAVNMDRADWPPLQVMRNSDGGFEAIRYLEENPIPDLPS